jgi:hypothetical protein
MRHSNHPTTYADANEPVRDEVAKNAYALYENGGRPQWRDKQNWLEAEANAVVAESSYHAVRRVSCEVRDCVLILRGRVPSFYMKQIAQTVVRHLLESGMVINNQLEVDGA